jgi:hypothetical protein
MTREVARVAKKNKAAPKPNRARTAPIQIYLTDEERDVLREMALRHGMSASELIRMLIADAE